MMPRLDGNGIARRFGHYRSLVRKGVAGFIIFGGRLETVRKYIALLQDDAELPLIIGSDLERGLGQQVKGGTLFPSAMACAAAVRNMEQRGEAGQGLKMFRAAYAAIAEEARYAGINTIFSPVLDINTNPANPIISVRAFGEDATTVAFFGTEVVRILQRNRVAACGKHFPGHGDTRDDSHLRLATVGQPLSGLRRRELRPFADAIAAGVRMIMLGHLKVPALDPSAVPVSRSRAAVRFLREKMEFDGIVITDAMNMAGIGHVHEERAAAESLMAGADIILHPTDAEKTSRFLNIMDVPLNAARVERFRLGLRRECSSSSRPPFQEHARLAGALATASVSLSGTMTKFGRRPPFLIILNDDPAEKGGELIAAFRKHLHKSKSTVCRSDADCFAVKIPEGHAVVLAVFSEIRAWKGGAQKWLPAAVRRFGRSADAVISFGSPYLLNLLPKGMHRARITTCTDLPEAQREVARSLLDMI